MPKIRVPISNFQFGEVSPNLASRTDSNVYQNAGKQIENFFLKMKGGYQNDSAQLNYMSLTPLLIQTTTFNNID